MFSCDDNQLDLELLPIVVLVLVLLLLLVLLVLVGGGVLLGEHVLHFLRRLDVAFLERDFLALLVPLFAASAGLHK